jgi:GH24 family phage-related lysozyme (muramidase)
MPTLKDTVTQKLRDLLSLGTHENRIPWLYRDNLGHLTIGVGHLLLKVEKSKARDNYKAPLTNLLTYEHEFVRDSQTFAADYVAFCAVKAKTPSLLGPIEGQGAVVAFVDKLTTSTVVDDTVPGPWGLELDTYKKAKAENPPLELLIDEALNMMTHKWTTGTFKDRPGIPFGGKKAGDFFECHSTFRLTEKGVDKLLDDDIKAKLSELDTYVKQDQINQWPNEAVLAVVDLIFQWGAKGIFNHAKTADGKEVNKELADAIKAQDWATAATKVPAADGGARTKDRINLFTKAAAAKTPGKK